VISLDVSFELESSIGGSEDATILLGVETLVRTTHHLCATGEAR
jgi:hypothetical protein